MHRQILNISYFLTKHFTKRLLCLFAINRNKHTHKHDCSTIESNSRTWNLLSGVIGSKHSSSHVDIYHTERRGPRVAHTVRFYPRPACRRGPVNPFHLTTAIDVRTKLYYIKSKMLVFAVLLMRNGVRTRVYNIMTCAYVLVRSVRGPVCTVRAFVGFEREPRSVWSPVENRISPRSV